MRELRTADDVYETVGAMMRFVAGAPGCEPWLRQIDETWRFSLSDPEAEITCAFPAAGPLQVDLGRSQLAADTTIVMEARDASAYMLGELNVFLEIDRGRLSIEGSRIAFLRVIPRMRGLLGSVYREVLQADRPPRWFVDASGQ